MLIIRTRGRTFCQFYADPPVREAPLRLNGSEGEKRKQRERERHTHRHAHIHTHTHAHTHTHSHTHAHTHTHTHTHRHRHTHRFTYTHTLARFLMRQNKNSWHCCLRTNNEQMVMVNFRVRAHVDDDITGFCYLCP